MVFDERGIALPERARDLHGNAKIPLQELALDAGFDRHRVVVRLDRSARKTHAIRVLLHSENARSDWRPRIVALELSQLPLPGEHPDWIPHFRAQTAAEVFGAGAA